MTHWIELPRTRIKITGRDALAVLHNFSTANVKQLAPNQCTEAFILNGKGKLVGHVYLTNWNDWLELNTVPDQANSLIRHLDQYVIREQVVFADLSPSNRHLFLFELPTADNSATAPLATVQFPELATDRASQWETPAGVLDVVRSDFAGKGYLVSIPTDRWTSLVSSLTDAGVVPATEQQLTQHRIAARTPWFTVDSDSDCLPQELDRDDRAICFDKGCYLGQETVARIDALGKVNRKLVRLRSTRGTDSNTLLGNLPCDVLVNNQVVGRITSAAFDPSLAQWQALALLKRSALTSDELMSPAGLNWEVWR